MKKTKIMALALVGVIALTGAGYAAWNTNIQYNNTIKTANWNVFVENDAVGDSLVASDEVDNFNSDSRVTGIASADGYNKYDKENILDLSGASKDKGTNFVYTVAPTITTTIEDSDTVNFKFYNMHPGTKANTRFEIRNLGTIPAKIESVKLTVTRADGSILPTNDPLYNAILVNGTFKDHVGSGTATTIGTIAANTKLSGLQAELTRILVNQQLKEQHSIFALDGSEMEVEPGLQFSIPADALKAGGKNVGMLSDLKVKVDFNFVQYNQNVPNVK